MQISSRSRNYFAPKIFTSFKVLAFFGGFVGVTSLDNITNAVKGKSTVDAEIMNVAKTKSFY